MDFLLQLDIQSMLGLIITVLLVGSFVLTTVAAFIFYCADK